MEGNIFQKLTPNNYFESNGLFVGVRVVTQVDVVGASGEGQRSDEGYGLASEGGRLLNLSDLLKCDCGNIQHKGRRGSGFEGMSGGTSGDSYTGDSGVIERLRVVQSVRPGMTDSLP